MDSAAKRQATPRAKGKAKANGTPPAKGKAKAEPDGKKLKQSTLAFGTINQSPAAAKRTNPGLHTAAPAKKAKLDSPATPDPVVIDITDDQEPATPATDNTDNRDDTLPKVHPLSSLVGSALKRKLRKRKTTTTKPKKINEKSPVESKKIEKGEEEMVHSDFVEVILDENSDDRIEKPSEDQTEKPSENQIDKPSENQTKSPSEDQIDKPSEDQIEKPSADSEISANAPSDNVPMEVESESDEKNENDEVSVNEENKSEVVPADDGISKSSGPLKTPKRSKVPSDLENSTPDRKLTPKQLQRKLESEKRKLEKERERLEREKKRQEEMEERRKSKLEKEEQKKKEREEKEEQRKKEREEKEKQKENEKKERDELKRKEREEKEHARKLEKEAKDEEKRRREQEKEEERKRKQEEADLKMKKTVAAFANFFVPKEKTNSSKDVKDSDVSVNDYLSIFRVKADMRLAPIVRCLLVEDSKRTLEELIAKQAANLASLYLASLKTPNYSIKSTPKTWPLSDIKDDVVLVEDDLPPVDDIDFHMENSQKQKFKAKLLSFADNRRPPYWGTWRKKSKFISGRRPFGLDKELLDYECDSDDEWEEEEPGESVESIAGSDEEDGDNEYDVDNEFMVPHGYLSEEEALGDDDPVDVSPETQKLRLKVLEDEFENERKKATERLHPRLLGIVWESSENDRPETCSDPIWNFLCKRRMLFAQSPILIQPSSERAEDDNEDGSNKPESEVKKRKIKISDSMIPDLIKLVHGNTNNKKFLCNEFSAFIQKDQMGGACEKEEGKENDQPPTPTRTLSKMAVIKKIQEISKWIPCPDEGVMQSKMCWYVDKSVREQYGLEGLSPLNEWEYALVPKRRVKQTLDFSTPEEPKEPASGKKENGFHITKFTKVLSKEERFISPNPAKSEETTQEVKEKKRVSLLVSGPRGVALPPVKPEEAKKKSPLVPKTKNQTTGARNNLMSQFIKVRNLEEINATVNNQDCVVLSD